MKDIKRPGTNISTGIKVISLTARPENAVSGKRLSNNTRENSKAVMRQIKRKSRLPGLLAFFTLIPARVRDDSTDSVHTKIVKCFKNNHPVDGLIKYLAPFRIISSIYLYDLNLFERLDALTPALESA